MFSKVVREIGKATKKRKFFIRIQVHRYVEYAKKKSNETNLVRNGILLPKLF